MPVGSTSSSRGKGRTASRRRPGPARGCAGWAWASAVGCAIGGTATGSRLGCGGGREGGFGRAGGRVSGIPGGNSWGAGGSVTGKTGGKGRGIGRTGGRGGGSGGRTGWCLVACLHEHGHLDGNEVGGPSIDWGVWDGEEASSMSSGRSDQRPTPNSSREATQKPQPIPTTPATTGDSWLSNVMECLDDERESQLRRVGPGHDSSSSTDNSREAISGEEGSTLSSAEPHSSL
mmetsp:Transcript_11486/g.35828  ORF Transcript_11486/g.35828 Transcript_11486/m.35828 type:complete len:232 (+) Transcript_11486:1564-2259(+)